MEISTSLSSRALQFYVIAGHWATDLEFFNTETAFLYHLLIKYQSGSSRGDGLNEVKEIKSKLLKLEADVHAAGLLLGGQMQLLELMAEDIIPEDTEALTAEQIRLEHLIANLLGEYRETKKQLFKLFKKNLGKNEVTTSI